MKSQWPLEYLELENPPYQNSEIRAKAKVRREILLSKKSVVEESGNK